VVCACVVSVCVVCAGVCGVCVWCVLSMHDITLSTLWFINSENLKFDI